MPRRCSGNECSLGKISGLDYGEKPISEGVRLTLQFLPPIEILKIKAIFRARQSERPPGDHG